MFMTYDPARKSAKIVSLPQVRIARLISTGLNNKKKKNRSGLKLRNFISILFRIIRIHNQNKSSIDIRSAVTKYNLITMQKVINSGNYVVTAQNISQVTPLK